MSLTPPVRKIEPAVLINPSASDFAQSNVILNGRNTRYSAVDVEGTLSIKCVVQGRAEYEASGGRFVVTPNSYLILNNRQTYTINIASEEMTETFCVFFQPDFAERALHSLVTPADRLLDDPFDYNRQSVLFFEKLHAYDSEMTHHLRELRAATKQGSGDSGWFEERLYLLLQQILCTHRNLYREIEALPAQRAATRVELYRRLHRAKDFMEAMHSEPLTLESIAEVAWLSPCHFLRLYKQAFGVTPHRHLAQIRLESAARLLLSGDAPVSSIGCDTGWDSHSSFSRAFRQKHGVSPESFRRRGGALPAK